MLGGHSTATTVGNYVVRLGAGYPLTSLVHGLKGGDKRRVVDLTVDGPLLAQVLIHSAAGRLNPPLRKTLAEQGLVLDARTVTIGRSSGVYDLTEDIWAPYAPRKREPCPFHLSAERLGLYTGGLEMRFFSPLAVSNDHFADR